MARKKKSKAAVPGKQPAPQVAPTQQLSIPVSAEDRTTPPVLYSKTLGAPLPPAPGRGDDSVITAERVYYFKLTRFNPIRQLTPEMLSIQFDQFRAGYLRYLALMFEAIEHRDDTLMTVIPKRKSAVKRLKWQVILNEDLSDDQKAEAEAHKEALFYFYNHLEVTDAIDLNRKGGFSMLVDQMMNAIGHFWAAHEIIWKPGLDGLTARLNYVPLWFFENRTGKLRYLVTDFQLDGQDLDPNSWMVTCGPGLLEPSAVAYMFKHLGLKDWLLYCEKHGMPGIVGKTNAAPGTPQWDALKQAVQDVAADFSCITNKDDEIDAVSFTTQGELPYPKLVDKMDRALVTIWRGSDLSTISGATSQGGQGASLQGKEEYNIQCSDAALITETLNENIDKKVIEYFFGEGVKPLAYVKVVVPPNVNVDTDIQTFEFLGKSGVELGKNQLREHFGIGEPMPDDEPAEGLQTPAPGLGPNGLPVPLPQPGVPAPKRFAANERLSPEVSKTLLTTARDQMARETGDALKPLVDRIEAILEMPNEQAMMHALKKFHESLPNLLSEINQNPANADALYKAMTSSWFNGFLNAEVVRS